MSTLAEALYTILSGAGTTAGTRIYPQSPPPQATFPLITYQQISTVRDRVLSGFNNYESRRYQVTSWGSGFSTGYPQARVLADEVIAALEDYSGTVLGITIQAVTVAGEVDIFEPNIERYGVATDFIIHDA